MTQELVRPLTDEEMQKRGWKVFVNGEEMPDAALVEIRNEGMDVLCSYGMRPEGYDGIIWREPNGGGSVILPYTLWDGELYIGVLNQNRPLQGGEIPNTPRGFADPGETHFEAATREAEEELREAGVASGQLSTPHALYDVGVNPNSAIHDAGGEGEGVHFFGMDIAPVLLREKNGRLMFRDEIAKPASAMGERISGCYFVPWHEFIRQGDGEHPERSRDGFTITAITTLLSYLRDARKLSLNFRS